MTPFITFYTPTFRRPVALSACMGSVQAQTVHEDIEHLIVPDYVGVGIGGMYSRVREYAPAVHGRYVHLLADDDVLATPHVVGQVEQFAAQHNDPAVILVAVEKNGAVWPDSNPWPPRCGHVDLGCIITRSDVWRQHVADYGTRYEGDFDFMRAVCDAGHHAAYLDVLFLRGAVMRGAPEVAA